MIKKHYSTICMFAVALSGTAVAQNATVPGDTCAGGNIAVGGQQANNNAIYQCTSTGGTQKWYPQPLYIGTSSATCDASHEGLHRYNNGTVEFCNGYAWTSLLLVQSASTPTAPSGSGYLVLSHTTWNGNLGGVTGADAKCFTELTSTYTSWRGYATANSNGQLTTGKIHALLCGYGYCNNLMPLTTYAFAYANSGTPGGATFTTDSNGRGPGDSANWSGAAYFGGSYTYWTNMDTSTDSLWFGLPDGNIYGAYLNCSDWTDGTSGQTGEVGNSNNTDINRWDTSTPLCNTTQHLLCLVNP